MLTYPHSHIRIIMVLIFAYLHSFSYAPAHAQHRSSYVQVILYAQKTSCCLTDADNHQNSDVDNIST